MASEFVDNRVSASVNGVPTQTRAYDAADQVTSAGYGYDGAGNLLTDGTSTYTYDPLGRLAGTVVGGSTTAYAYNGDNTLATKTVGRATTRYTLDTQGGLSERLGQTAGGAATWYLRGWGAELARGTSGGTTWYLADRLGSVRGEYGATPTVAGKTNDDPFGQPETGSGLGSPADYGFTGEPQGDGAGLLQLRARWYQPGSGQFTSRDPFAGDAGTPQSYGPYAYAHNDPTNLTDPTGRTPLREPGAGGAGEGGTRAASADQAAVQALGLIADAGAPGGCGVDGRLLIAVAVAAEKVVVESFMALHRALQAHLNATNPALVGGAGATAAGASQGVLTGSVVAFGTTLVVVTAAVTAIVVVGTLATIVTIATTDHGRPKIIYLDPADGHALDVHPVPNDPVNQHKTTTQEDSSTQLIWRAISLDPNREQFNFSPSRLDSDGLSGTKGGKAPYWTNPVLWFKTSFKRDPNPSVDRIVATHRGALVGSGFSVVDTPSADTGDPHHVSIGGITPGVVPDGNNYAWRGTRSERRATREFLAGLFVQQVWP